MSNRAKSKSAKKRKQTKGELSASEIRYRRLFESAQDGILILDTDSGLIVDVNPFLIELLGYPREEFIGKALWDIGPFKHVDASKAAFRKLKEKGYVRYENLPLETSSGQPVNVEFVSNVYSANGKSVIQCNIRDITARRRAEQIDERMRQAQKMEAVGQLAGGVAHDFNNLLAVIMGACEVLEPRLTAGSANRKLVEQIHSAGTRAAVLTRQLLAFSRRQVLRPLILDLNGLVTGMEAMLRRLIGEHIEITTSLTADLGHVKADPTQIEQIIMNLAVNARDAMPDGGTITIETVNIQLNHSHRLLHTEVKPGSYVMLSVSDKGVGMTSETQLRMFEPFFTTKPPGKGTGLGLSTVYGIVKQSAGYIWAESELGEGTTIKIFLPRFEGKADVLLSPEETATLPRGKETILLVEDNTPLRELVREMLKGFGYAVLDSGLPADALRAAELHDGPIALLITDVVMPGLNGRALAQTLIKARPQIKVIYTSGYSDEAIIEQCELDTGNPVLGKPFTRDALAKKVRETLDASAS